MLSSKARIAGLVTFALFLSWACGGGESDNNGNGPSSSPTTETADSLGSEPDDTATAEPAVFGNVEPGTAKLTIGDESWTFEIFSCGFTPEENGDENLLFDLKAQGETSDGVEIWLTASIDQVFVVGHDIALRDIGSFSDPVISWTAHVLLSDDEEGFITIDGKRITASAMFQNDKTDRGVGEMAGTFTANCR